MGVDREFKVKVGAEADPSELKLFAGHMGEVKKGAKELAQAFPEVATGIRLLANPIGGAVALATAAFVKCSEAIEQMNKASEDTMEINSNATFLNGIKAYADSLREATESFEGWLRKLREAPGVTAELNAQLEDTLKLLELQNKSHGVAEDSTEAIEARRKAMIAQLEKEKSLGGYYPYGRDLGKEAIDAEEAAEKAEARKKKAATDLPELEKSLAQQRKDAERLNVGVDDDRALLKRLQERGASPNVQNELRARIAAAEAANSRVQTTQEAVDRTRGVAESMDPSRLRLDAESKKAEALANKEAIDKLTRAIDQLTIQGLFAKPNGAAAQQLGALNTKVTGDVEFAQILQEVVRKQRQRDAINAHTKSLQAQ